MAKSRRLAPVRARSGGLWICPQCRRSFTNRNQVHSCGRFSVQRLLDGKDADVADCFQRLAAMIARCGDDVIVAPTKTRVLFKIRTVFASVTIARRWLDMVLVLGRRLTHRRVRKAQREYPGIVHSLRIECADDLDDELAAWLQEAADYRRAQDLGA